MAKFRYIACTTTGRAVKGEAVGASAAQVLARLEQEGLIVESLVRVAESSLAVPLPPPSDWSLHVAPLVAVAAQLAPAIRALAEELPSGGQRRDYAAAAQVLSGGRAEEIAAALSARPGMWLPLLAAARDGASPAAIVQRLVIEWTAPVAALGRRWLWLVYPMTMLGLAGAVLVFCGLVALRPLTSLYADFQLQLPHMTTLALALMAVAIDPRMWVAIAIAVGVLVLLWGLRGWLQSTALGRWLALRPSLDIGGHRPRGRLASAAATWCDAARSPAETLALAAPASDSLRISLAAQTCAAHLAAGEPVTGRALRTAGVATNLALASELPPATKRRLLAEIGDCFAERDRRWGVSGVSHSSSLVTIVIGLLVGWLVAATYLPLVKLIEGLS